MKLDFQLGLLASQYWILQPSDRYCCIEITRRLYCYCHMTIHMRGVLRESAPAFYLEPCFFLMENLGCFSFADLFCHMKER